MEIFVDLDGVLADFVKDACLAHGRENPYLNPEMKTHEKSESDNCLRRLFEMSYQEFWSPLNGSTFWEKLDVLEDGRDMLYELEDHYGKKNIYFLSTPSSHISSYIGKYKWINEHFPYYLSRTFLAQKKERFAKPDSILIDDKISNCLKFIKSGGMAYVYNTPWNKFSLALNYTIPTIDKLIIKDKFLF